MPRILIVEDEAVLRSSMARGLRRQSLLEVDEAGSLDEAIPFLDASPPDLVLSDIDLPGRSGIEILGELGKRGLRVPVVFVSAYLKAYGAQIPRHADVEVREKPVGLEELRRLVALRVGSGEAAPEASPFSVADFVQLASLGRHSVVIERRRGGVVEGTIVVASGEVWSARLGPSAGNDALRRLLFSTEGEITCRTLREAPGERNVYGGWQEILIEAARQEDEEAAARAASSRAEVPPGATSLPAEADPFDATWEEGIAALLRKDYLEAFRSFAKASKIRPEDRKVAANLARLREMGFSEGAG